MTPIVRRRNRCTGALALLIALVAPTLAGASSATDRIVLPNDVTPERYDVSVEPEATKLTFKGAESILIDVLRPTAGITLNAADLAFQSVTVSGEPGAPRISLDAAQETATLHFVSPIAAGRHVLRIAFTGKINENAAGLFALDYDTAQGKGRALFTQFENSDARRFIPCWDEPARKAVFSLSAVIPSGQMAVSNMPVAADRPLRNGRRRVDFAASPKMSSYLLFFALGDFERISRKVDNVDVGVIVKRGDGPKARFALDAASQILPYYENYFGVKYPLPKLDLVAGPGESQFFGAMENWGAIFYFERDLLIDPAIATADDRRHVYIATAHEMAHQWFGDLVTMQWWDDLWLNEGFASWMELKATDHFHPEWKVWLDALSAKEAAMEVDARTGTHPVIQPIRDVLQANAAFDTITYAKGRAVISMLENYLGAHAFRDGIRRYVKTFAYRNAISDDLWRSLDEGATVPVTAIAHDFTLQAGVPLIRVGFSADHLRLAQDVYIADGLHRSGQSWHVPVIETPLTGNGEWSGIVSRGAPVTLPAPRPVVPIVNGGQAGYFRTLYGVPLFSRLAADFARLLPSDQLGLLNDSLALGLSGFEPIADYASLVRRAPVAKEPLVLKTLAVQLQRLDHSYDGLPTQPRYRAFARSVLSPVMARIGWNPRNNESPNVPLLRESVLEALGAVQDPFVLAQAQRRFQDYALRGNPLSADERRIVFSIVTENADQATWNELLTLARKAKSFLEKREFYEYLARASDAQLARRTLQLSLSDEVPLTTRPRILQAVAVWHPQMALAFLAAHLTEFNRAIEPDSRAQFAPDIARDSNDPQTIVMLRAFAVAHIPPHARGDETRAEAAIAYNVKVRRERLPELDRWIAAHGHR